MGKPAGAIGADTLDVLQGFGYSPGEIDGLVAKGAILSG